MTIGETLKRARNKKNLELDDVVRDTKIAKMFLIALESDDISSLPKGVYTRNFLRTYARYLDLDEGIVTAEYHDQYGIKPHFVTQQEQTKRDNQQFIRSRRRSWLALFFLILIPALAAYIYFGWGDEIDEMLSSPTSERVTTPTEPPSTPARAPLPETWTPGEEESAGEPVPPADPGRDAAETGTGGEEPATSKDPLPVEDETHDEPVAEENPAGDEVSETTDGAPTEADDPGPETTEPFVLRAPEHLPVTQLDGVDWLGGEPAENITDMFAVEALARVWIRVTIDGVVVTERILEPGEVRFYRHGELNVVSLGDTYAVAIQAGEEFKERVHVVRSSVRFEFRPGELFDALEARMAIRAEWADEEQ